MKSVLRYCLPVRLLAALLPACGVLLSSLLPAQSPLASLQGIVQDQAGARIRGAKVVAQAAQAALRRDVVTDERGRFHFQDLQPGLYLVSAEAQGFASVQADVDLVISSVRETTITLKPAAVRQSVIITGEASSITAQPIDTTSAVHQSAISAQDLAEIPLASRSFANIAYLAPMTEPVEPSDPTKARITAVSFGGSSGLNVDLSVDGGDNNDDYIGGFLQNYSPDALQEFTVRTAQYDADTSRTNGGSVVISTRRGSDEWHGSGAYFYRGNALNARNTLDNPEPNPKQPFSRQNVVGTLGGPIKPGKLWFFSSYEYIHENASIAYSANSLAEFNALQQLAAGGLLPNAGSIGAIPSSVLQPYRETLFSSRVDWRQSSRSQWFLRGSLDRNHARNDLLQQGALPSTGATTDSNYYSVLLSEQFQFAPTTVGVLTLEASGFHHTKARNSTIGEAFDFPFTANFLTTSGRETFGDNQFATAIDR